MTEPVNDSNWTNYYRAVEGRPPRETLLQALAAFDAETPAMAPRMAIDMGCGTGVDTFELLRHGWRVLAMDAGAEAIARVRADAPPEAPLEARQIAFEAITALPSCELINASFSLPFCAPAQFPTLWAMLVGALRSGGRFAGQLFGVHDSWASEPDMNFHSRADVETLLALFTIEHLEEVDRDGETATGTPKHWHVFHIVARRR